MSQRMILQQFHKINKKDTKKSRNKEKYGPRGMDFEDRLKFVNLRYLNLKVAVIDKRPTPVKVIEVVDGKVSGFFERKSTIDYDGTYNARSLYFEVINGERQVSSK